MMFIWIIKYLVIFYKKYKGIISKNIIFSIFFILFNNKSTISYITTFYIVLALNMNYFQQILPYLNTFPRILQIFFLQNQNNVLILP